MGFSKFEFWPIESFQHMGVFGLDSVEAASDRIRFGSWSSMYMNFLCSVSLGQF